MKILEIIDVVQRKINSLIFRVLLIVYSIIILTTHTNLLHSYVYVIVFILYISTYLSLLNYQKLRLVNDFVFITFCIVGKNPNEAFIFIYLLLPIINSINFSGNKKSPILFLVTASAYLFLFCYYNRCREFGLLSQSILPLCSLFFLWIIEYYTTLRIKIRDFREKLNEVVDSFYTEKEFLKKPHKVYSQLIDLINIKIKKNLIYDLFCFTVLPGQKNKIVIVNGSRFIWQYKLNETALIEGFREKQYQININFEVEGVNFPFNLVIRIEIEKIEYFFIFSTQRNIPLYYIMIGFFRTLVPALSKMAKILLSERHLQEIRTEELNKLSIRSQYVTRATKTMHYIRNRLGPVNNLIKMLDNQNNIQQEKQKSFNSLLVSEKDRAKIELQNIVKRANYLLEKSNNPFNFAQIEKVSLRKFFSVVRRNINLYFPSIDINIQMADNIEISFVEINDEGFEIFLSDWLNNIKKYNNGQIEVNFSISEDVVKVEFLNNYHVDEQSINKLILDLMSNGRNEIMKRTTHGIYQIKTSLEEMNIDYKIERENRDINMIKFTISLKLFKDENSSI